jgi:hypothetical protein
MIGCSLVAEAQDVSCQFDKSTLSFKGSPAEQDRCLLRHVKPGGILEPVLSNLPTPLEELIDKPVEFSKDALRQYLNNHGIAEEAIGGSLDDPISRGRNNNPSAPLARYFVIHDFSTPNLCETAQFPANIDELSWQWNRVCKYRNSKDAHLYITRDGMSIAPQNRTFKDAWRATKLEGPKNDLRARGMFLHIENVQPRRCVPDLNQPSGLKPDRRYYKWDSKEKKWVCRNDRIAPDPGLAEKQMDRLALVYVAASARRGSWLIPAFHAATDAGISDTHDDPQYFDLQKWADRLCVLLRSLNKGLVPGNGN